MVMVKNKSCDVDRLTNLVRSHIPTATIESQVSAEISYLLPFAESRKFEALFREIEAKMSELGVNSFGTSATTMEEVFLKYASVVLDCSQKGCRVKLKSNHCLGYIIILISPC